MARTEGAVPPAVVIGLDSVTGLQTARVLARRGIPVVGVARQRDHMACRTNACRRIAFCETRTPDLLTSLLRLRPSFDAPPVLFPCTDLAVQLVSTGRAALAGRFLTVLPPPGVIERLIDKAAFHEYALEAGLPVAATHVLRNRADAKRAAALLSYPAVLKPSIKSPRWQAATNVKLFRADSAGELLACYDECHDWADVLIAQEWIAGPDERHFTCNAYFDAASRPRLTFVSQKIRQWPLEGGVGCLSRSCRHDRVRETTIRLFQGIGHHGPAYLEMKEDARSGGLVIIEPNVGRPTGRSAAADLAGVELLYTQYCDAAGLPLPPAREQPEAERRWIYFRHDCQSAFTQWRAGALKTSEWWRSLRRCHGDAVFSWSDPRPFVADVAHAMLKTARASRSSAARAPHRPPRMSPGGDPPEGVVDHDIHGIVGVRLIDASPADAAAVSRQIGPSLARLTREPDIVIRFVDRLPADQLRWIEYGRTGFNEDGFFVQQQGLRAARAQVAFEGIGRRCEIACEHGARSVPLLMGIVTASALAKGAVPLHASAFLYRDTGVLVTGWAKGGKTEALLAFAAHGAEYVGDEWILLSDDGARMHGIPEQIRLQDWHLDQVPHVRPLVRRRQRVFFKAVRAADRTQRLLNRSSLGSLCPFSTISDAMPALKRQLNVQLDPARVFGDRPHACTARLDAVFFMVSHDDPSTVVEQADPDDLARRMTASVCYEHLLLSSTYLAYRFAFPDRRSELLDGFDREVARSLAASLRGRPTYLVRHPYPCRLEQLFEAMAPFCRERSATAVAAPDALESARKAPHDPGTNVLRTPVLHGGPRDAPV
ncbi:MAG TPA: hypothetical protein VNK41_11680 [Vicinamibacterales bacterium]|nr:hypothetical protein [Vicinamibacterales bacterium]